jgi:hypothetical protein
MTKLLGPNPISTIDTLVPEITGPLGEYGETVTIVEGGTSVVKRGVIVIPVTVIWLSPR